MGSQASNCRILMIDDEPGYFEILSAYVTAEGFTIDYASRGKDGIALTKKEKYDLVLSRGRARILNHSTCAG
jgi:DNA-binding response OmpR family regulator